MPPVLFDRISVEELTEFAEVNEDVMLSFRSRDEAHHCYLSENHNTSTSSALSPWETLKTLPSVWVPTWCGEIIWPVMARSTLGTNAHARLRLGGTGGTDLIVTSVTAIRVELVMPITSEGGSIADLDIQGYAVGSGALQISAETSLIVFRRAA